MKRDIIGIAIEGERNIKPEFLKGSSGNDIISIEMYRDKKYGAIAEIYYGFSFSKVFGHKSKKQKVVKEKEIDWDKPVDTSKWVKPDEESIRRELVKNLLMCEIVRRESNLYQEHFAKASVCYSILHSIHPKNPQILTNYATGESEPLEVINREYKITSKFRKEFKRGIKLKLFKYKKYVEKLRKNREKWYEEMKKGMIRIMGEMEKRK